jgi:hypothetical protein
MSSGQPDMTDVRVGRVMLLRRDKPQRIAVETEIRDRRPRYGEMLTLSVEGTQVRAKITAVWRPPPPHSHVCMINADETLPDPGPTA